jgi:hypothetical protein
MSTVYNPEADRIAEIERLEIDARAMRLRIERAKTDDDKRVLQKLLKETEDRIVAIRARLP